MIRIEGKGGVSATMVLDSQAYSSGVRLSTFELEYPRIVHSEFLTHRVMTRNSASSRAIPFAKMQQQLTGRPVRFGAANKGMQDSGECSNLIEGMYTPEEWWDLFTMSCSRFSRGYYDAGYHKQVYNRTTEPSQMIKTVMSTTEIQNFFWLRCDESADPTLVELAECIQECYGASSPKILYPGEWHLPYVDMEGAFYYLDGQDLLLEDAIEVSAAKCAAVSYRNTDYTLEKCRDVYEKLRNSGKLHGSALEHQATPVASYECYLDDRSMWSEGITHQSRNGDLWSGNFRMWVQHRKMIPGENYEG